MLDRPLHPDDALCWALERALKFPKLKRAALGRLRKAERGHYYTCGVRDAVEIFLQLYGNMDPVDWNDVIGRVLEPLAELGMTIGIDYSGRMPPKQPMAMPFGIRLTGSRAVLEAFASGNCPHRICWRQQCDECRENHRHQARSAPPPESDRP